jgi:two-component system cell cycle sensor histidine kinase/response regulator CckA
MMDRELAERLLGEMARLRQSIEAPPEQDPGQEIDVDHGRTERALADARQERDLAFEASGMGQWRWNVERDEVIWDDTTQCIFGVPAHGKGMTYATFLQLIHPEDREAVRQHTERVLTTGRFLDLDCRLVRPDGKVRCILVKGKVRSDASGRPLELFGGLLDVTDNKEVETTQRRIQKLEAIGQLAGGVAHDFNNLLVAIVGNVELAKRAAADEREAMLDEVLQACARATALTQQLLAFARRQTVPDTAIDLNDLLTDTVCLLRRLIPENIEIDLITAHALPLVLADRGQLEQVVMNLCVNSRDAMPRGGKLLLETETVVINGKFRESHPWARPGRYVLLTVTDTGCGIPAGHIERVFDPFFTTKENGTGLGLATVYGIVKRHGGLVHVYSETNRGTTFKVYLPVSERQASQIGTKLEEPVRGGPETILVVEDEPHVRAVVMRILAGAGYAIIEARDGVEAVELYKQHRARIDLVLMDAVMPRMGGPEALTEIRALAPRQPVIISSGYSEAGGGPIANLAAEFLPKPYEPDALLRIVRRTLDEAREANNRPSA